jgi:Flp pilus assembly protein TadD
LKDEWWEHMQERLRNRFIGPQEEGALAALSNCALAGSCQLPEDRMLETFKAALSRGANAEVNSILGNYMLNNMHRPDVALYLWNQASEMRPQEPQYRINLIKLLIFLEQDQDAREQIAQLRRIGRLGQYAAIADQLEGRLAGAIRSRPQQVK